MNQNGINPGKPQQVSATLTLEVRVDGRLASLPNFDEKAKYQVLARLCGELAKLAGCPTEMVAHTAVSACAAPVGDDLKKQARRNSPIQLPTVEDISRIRDQ